MFQKPTSRKNFILCVDRGFSFWVQKHKKKRKFFSIKNLIFGLVDPNLLNFHFCFVFGGDAEKLLFVILFLPLCTQKYGEFKINIVKRCCFGAKVCLIFMKIDKFLDNICGKLFFLLICLGVDVILYGFLHSVNNVLRGSNEIY